MIEQLRNTDWVAWAQSLVQWLLDQDQGALHSALVLGQAVADAVAYLLSTVPGTVAEVLGTDWVAWLDNHIRTLVFPLPEKTLNLLRAVILVACETLSQSPNPVECAVGLGQLAVQVASEIANPYVQWVTSQVPGDPVRAVTAAAATVLGLLMGVAGPYGAELQRQAEEALRQVEDPPPLPPDEPPCVACADGETNTGVSPVPYDPGSHIFAPSPRAVALKMAELEKLAPLTLHDLAVGITGAPDDPPEGDSQQMGFIGFGCLDEPLAHCLRWAGRIPNHPGHFQETGYTCGPASARNILEQFYGTDWREGPLAKAMKTSREGSSIGNLMNVLNDPQFSQSENKRDTFMIDKVPEPWQLMVRVQFDVGTGRRTYHGNNFRGPHGVVLNLNQTVLEYWGRDFDPTAGHFNVAFGYDTRSAGSIDVMEVRNVRNPQTREYIGGPHHKVPLVEVHAAVIANRINKGMIVW